MASIRINLINQDKKPTISYDADLGHISVLIDTGANIPIYFGNVSTFLLDFPDAIETKYITYIMGLGGKDTNQYPIYSIPEFKLKDSYCGQENLVIYNMPIVIYNAKTDYGYNMLLGSTTFSLVDFSFVHRVQIPYMQIDFDRDIYSTIRPCQKTDGEIYEVDGKIVVDHMRTFFQQENTTDI